MPKRVKLIGLLKAKAGMSRVEYERRYLEGHAPLARKFKHLSGLRFSVVNDALQQGNAESPYDGVVEFWWDSFEDIGNCSIRPSMSARMTSIASMAGKSGGLPTQLRL